MVEGLRGAGAFVSGGTVAGTQVVDGEEVAYDGCGESCRIRFMQQVLDGVFLVRVDGGVVAVQVAQAQQPVLLVCAVVRVGEVADEVCGRGSTLHGASRRRCPRA